MKMLFQSLDELIVKIEVLNDRYVTWNFDKNSGVYAYL